MLRNRNVAQSKQGAGTQQEPSRRRTISLSGAGRHLHRHGAQPETNIDSRQSLKELAGSRSPLRYLRMFLRQAQAEGEAAEEMLQSLKSLGREMSDLIDSLRLHFETMPGLPGALDLQVGNRTTLGDVASWIRAHLVPLAEAQSHTIELAIEPVVGLLPTNVLFGLVVEHLRKRVTDPTSRSHLRFSVTATACGVNVEISEFGRTVPPTPIADENTRILWARVAHMLQGSISWSRLESSANGPSGNTIQITYPIGIAHQFDSATSALRVMRGERLAA